MTIEPEVWLRGPVEGIPAELLPAAHAFLQTLEDVQHAAAGLTPEQVWRTPGGAPSVGFHLRHLDGSTDRLLTYARGERLSADQRAALAGEQAGSGLEAGQLLVNVRARIASALDALRATRRRRFTTRAPSAGRRSRQPSSGCCSTPRSTRSGTRARSSRQPGSSAVSRLARGGRRASKAELDFAPAWCRMMSHAAARSARRNRSRPPSGR